MQKSFKFIRVHRRAAYSLIILFCVFSGLLISRLTFNQSFGMGDPSTFYDFAHNLDHGETIYKDFIHFRTPGDYAVETTFLKVFGDKMDALELALHVETLVFFPFLFMLAALLILRQKKNPLFLLAAFAGIALLPPIADLRVGFGLLAVACYYTSYEIRKHQKVYLFLTGILTSLTFTFGQEIAVMVAVLLVAGELFNRQGGRELWLRLRLLIGGAVVGILPLFLYIVIYSNFGNFLYYVFWYSFIIQPKFMDLPFPSFGYVNLLFYLPFLLYWLCFLVLYANRKLGKPATLVLGYGILQLITALGRSDSAHLIFSIPELFIVVPFYLFSIKDAQFSKKILRSFLPFGLAIIFLFLVAKVTHSFSIILVPFVMLYAIDKRPTDKASQQTEPTQTKLNVALALGISFALFIFLLFPMYQGSFLGARTGWDTRHNKSDEIEGVKADPITYQEVNEVEAAIKYDHPNTIFSFPIIAFFDTLAPHHASRNITFEFETTLNQQNQTIADLKRTKPSVVIFDPLQAEGESAAVWKISAYIMGHYQVQRQISSRDIYWVMTPEAHPTRNDKLVYQLYHDNTQKTNLEDAYGDQNSAQGLNYAIVQNNHQIHFFIDSYQGSHLQLSLDNTTGTTIGPKVCGRVVINYGTSKQISTVCTTDGAISLAVKPESKPVEILLENPGSSSIIWNNPRVTD